MSADDPVYIDPSDEGVAWAKQTTETASALCVLALPAEVMGPELGYSAHDWQCFRKGALRVLMKQKEGQ